MEEGEPKIKNVIQLSEKVLPATAEPGKEVIIRERDALKDDWSAFVSTVAEVSHLCFSYLLKCNSHHKNRR